MANWSVDFKKFSAGRVSKKSLSIWNEIKQKLTRSLENGENLFPKTVVGTVSITLNGRLIQVSGTGEEEKEKFYYGLNPNDLTATNGMVRLTDRFTKKPFETKYSDNIQKSFEFMLGFLNLLRVDAFTVAFNLKADINVLEAALEANKIPKLTVNSNPVLCTLDIITGDYILADKYPEIYSNCVSWNNPNTTMSVKDAITPFIEVNKVSSLSDYLEYYLQKGSRKRFKLSEFTKFFTLPKGLTDIVPVAIRFPEEPVKVTQSGINLVNNLDNVIFNKLCSDDITVRDLYCDFTDAGLSDTPDVDFYENFKIFQKSVKNKIFYAPSLSGGTDTKVEVACASKKDIYELTGIQFNNYSIGIMNLILSCMLKEKLGKFRPYSVSRIATSSFNSTLEREIKARNRNSMIS